MYGTFWALVPPVVAIVLALITKEVYSSLFVGIVVGAFFVAGFNPVSALDTMVNDGFIASMADGWNAGIFMFLVLLGIMVALVNSAGGSAAFGKWAAKHVHTRGGASLATFALGAMLFVDDYFNCLTTGSVMRTVTDSQRMSREKLAYHIDATAAPICMIAPISSWAAAVSATAQDLDTGVTGIQLFIQAIPYNFYSLMTIVFIITLSLMNFDYGPMAAAQLRAYQTGELGNLSPVEEPKESKASLWDMLIPVIVLIASCICGMMYVGGFFDGAGIIDAFANTDASVGLPWGAIIALLFSAAYLMLRRVITFKEVSECIVKGFNAMVPALLILTFALTLKNMTGALGADVFVAGLVEGSAESLFSMLPAIIFLVAIGLAFSTGTSWGTFGILIPIVLPVFKNNPDLLMIGISACLAGAVCGDHCSPISDTTIMASAGANVNHIAHVTTQLPYALTVAAISFVLYIVAGFVRNAVICLVLGAVVTVATLFVIRKITLKKENA